MPLSRRTARICRRLAVVATTVVVVGATAGTGPGATAGPAGAGGLPQPYVGPFTRVSTLGSTVPANGDVNPYGVAVVPRTVGGLRRGDVLISNFNDVENQQGTGTSIMDVNRSGTTRVFADIRLGRSNSCPGGVGLSTALAVLPQGWVVVGSLPTADGTIATAGRGCLIVLDPDGNVVSTVTGTMINGPWDLTTVDQGTRAAVFVSNVLNGTAAGAGRVVDRGTVVRFEMSLPAVGDGTPQFSDPTVIGSRFPEQANASALVLGPTGLAVTPDGTLFVANTDADEIDSFPDVLDQTASAGIGTVVDQFAGLNAPLGLAATRNGDVLAVNGLDGKLTEISPQGAVVATRTLDSTRTPGQVPGAGALFGLAVAPDHRGVYFVDDDTNTLDLLGAPTGA